MSGKYDFGVIRTLRQRMNLTLEKLAKVSGLTYPTVESIEKNKTSPSLKTLDALASALKISASDLVGLAENYTVITVISDAEFLVIHIPKDISIIEALLKPRDTKPSQGQP